MGAAGLSQGQGARGLRSTVTPGQFVGTRVADPAARQRGRAVREPVGGGAAELRAVSHGLAQLQPHPHRVCGKLSGAELSRQRHGADRARQGGHTETAPEASAFLQSVQAVKHQESPGMPLTPAPRPSWRKRGRKAAEIWQSRWRSTGSNKWGQRQHPYAFLR
jgi:hypothetical protein